LTIVLYLLLGFTLLNGENKQLVKDFYVNSVPKQEIGQLSFQINVPACA